MKKRIVAWITCALMILCMLPTPAMAAADTWDGTTVNTSWYNTTDITFTISTGTQLAGLAKLVNQGATESGDTPVDFSGKTIILGADIDLGGHQWTPIGIYEPVSHGIIRPFSGAFDGDGHTISNLAIGTSDQPENTLYMVGLFGEADGGSFINLSIENVGIYSSYPDAYVGALVGEVSQPVENCSASGNVTGGSNSAFVGGLVSCSVSDIKNCHASCKVVCGSDSYAGGLIAQLSGGSITDSYATGDVTGYNAGGLVEELFGTVSNSYATGDVTCSGTYGGGLTGYIQYSPSGSVSGCYATGDVTASGSGGSSIGGFAGYSKTNITGCFATGNVVSTGSGSLPANPVSVGGFAGKNEAAITRCYASGSVSGANGSCIGGLVGKNEVAASSGSVQDSYARGSVSGTGADIYKGRLFGHIVSGSTASDCYFDTRDTGIEGIGLDDTSPKQTVTGLAPDRMTGTAASANMTGLDFSAGWTAKANDSKWYFPQLAVFAGSSASLASVTVTPFKVDFNSNSGSAVASEYGYYSAVTKPADPIRSGYNFAGWFTNAELTSAYDFNTAVTGNTTLHAKWMAENYPITYNLDGGTAANPANYSLESDSFTLNNPTKPGYSFAGWTGTGLSGPTMTVTIPKGSMGSRSYTATWTKADFSITYNLNGGTLASPNPAGYSVESESFTLNNPAKPGCSFAGWTGTDLSVATVTVTIPKGSTGDRSYTAQWTPKGAYAIKTKVNNKRFGKVTGAGTYKGGDTVTLTAVPAKGYMLQKWTEGKTKVSAGGVYTFVAEKGRTLTATFVKIGTPKLSSVKVTGGGSIAVKWKAVSGVKGYYIYRATKKSGKYSKIKAVEGVLSFTDTGLAAGKTYYYKVQAYYTAGTKTTTGAFSKVLYANIKIGTPKLSSVKATGGGSIAVKWEAVSYVKGYYIYRATKKSGKYIRIQTVDGALSFTDTGLTAGKTYYYKVQAYYAAGTKITTGGYSKVLYAKVK